MRERGTVVATRGSRVDVRMTPGAACSDCGACSGVGESSLLEGVSSALEASVGDVVEIEILPAGRARAHAIVFVVPVVALMLGYLAGFLLFSASNVNPDAAGAVLGIGAGALSLGVVRRLGRMAGSDRYEPQVRAIISRGSTSPTGGVSPDRPTPPDIGGNDS